MVKRVLALTVALGLVLTGCGETTEAEFGSGFVGIREARRYFQISYGSVAACWPHDKMDFTEWQLAGEPKEKVWGFVSCRIGYTNRSGQEAHVAPGEVLTYGIP